MIRINQIKISIFDVGTDREREKALVRAKAAAMLGCGAADLRSFRLVRRSVDARDRDDILFVYTADVRLHESVTGPNAETEAAFIARLRNANIRQYDGIPLRLPTESGEKFLRQPEASAVPPEKTPGPVVVGSGPCGLFAAFVLAECGFQPLILERGGDVDTRIRKTELFFESGRLDPDCNIQFGEGGAGTFSDGKLNTSIKDRGGYIDFVLRTFVRFGADEDILIDQKPHVGTDVLSDIIRNMRKYIQSRGGRYLFNARFDGFEAADGQITAAAFSDTKTGERHVLPCARLILATGHSARDTYAMLRDAGLEMEAKPFAMGVRIQHPQELIDAALYGEDRLEEKRGILGPAAYKLTNRASNGRSCYSFCMCPGGYVVNSSSEEGRLCVNGMSYHDRGSGTANSALIVNVDPEDCRRYTGRDDLMCGVEFQRRLEEKAYAACDGVIPYETWAEFRDRVKGPAGVTAFRQNYLGYAAAADVRAMLPAYMGDAIAESIPVFGRSIRGFDADDAVIAGIEARTSSPLRILRGEDRQASIRGIYPAGEGAGYAGGITSAAADGIKTALAVIHDLLA